jgi:hydroxymethylpyrimidine pyrophosphatase-like HAD family hydrolase
MGLIIAVDFDGTITYDRPGYLAIDNLKPNVQKVLKRLRKEGNILILHTCRRGIWFEQALRFLKVNGIKFDHYNENSTERILEGKDPRKIYADIYIDDRQLGGIPDDWEEIYKIIQKHE